MIQKWKHYGCISSLRWSFLAPGVIKNSFPYDTIWCYFISATVGSRSLPGEMQKCHLKRDVGFPIPAHRLAVWSKNHVKSIKPAHLPLITILLSCLIYLNANILCASAKNKTPIRYMEWWGLKKLLKDLRITLFPVSWVMVEIPIEDFCYLHVGALRSKIYVQSSLKLVSSSCFLCQTLQFRKVFLPCKCRDTPEILPSSTA